MPEFNFKSPIVTRKVRETELILEEVIPSPFFIEKELKDINIVEAEANNIIRRTTKQSVYVVNHEMIFKGSYSDFIKVYLDIYKEVGIMLDSDGRVILDKSINYGKQ
nr:MAG: hypothetical protein [Bacteriophage sp.]